LVDTAGSLTAPVSGATLVWTLGGATKTAFAVASTAGSGGSVSSSASGKGQSVSQTASKTASAGSAAASKSGAYSSLRGYSLATIAAFTAAMVIISQFL
jgi:hypothetical protein